MLCENDHYWKSKDLGFSLISSKLIKNHTVISEKYLLPFLSHSLGITQAKISLSELHTIVGASYSSEVQHGDSGEIKFWLYQARETKLAAVKHNPIISIAWKQTSKGILHSHHALVG